MRRARSNLLLVALALSAGAVALPAQSALATGPVATRAVVLSPQGQPNIVGDAPGPLVTGRILLNSVNRGVPALSVVLERINVYSAYRTAGWTLLGRAVTDNNGYVRIRMPKPRLDSAYRIRFGGTNRYLPSTSRPKYFTVQPVVAVTGAPPEIVVGSPYAVTGQVRPAGLAGLRAYVQTACHSGTDWATSQNSYPVAPDGTFIAPYTVKPGYPALLGTTALRVRIVGPGGGNGTVNSAESAATPTAVVQTPGDPHVPGGPGDCVTVNLNP